MYFDKKYNNNVINENEIRIENNITISCSNPILMTPDYPISPCFIAALYFIYCTQLPAVLHIDNIIICITVNPRQLDSVGDQNKNTFFFVQHHTDFIFLLLFIYLHYP